MKPCIILRANPGHGYSVFNEDGRYVVSFFNYLNCANYAMGQGYTIVPHNSRVGKTILDKIERQRV